jgi:hypothetical protein
MIQTPWIITQILHECAEVFDRWCTLFRGYPDWCSGGWDAETACCYWFRLFLLWSKLVGYSSLIWRGWPTRNIVASSSRLWSSTIRFNSLICRLLSAVYFLQSYSAGMTGMVMQRLTWLDSSFRRLLVLLVVLCIYCIRQWCVCSWLGSASWLLLLCGLFAFPFVDKWSMMSLGFFGKKSEVLIYRYWSGSCSLG